MASPLIGSRPLAHGFNAGKPAVCVSHQALHSPHTAVLLSALKRRRTFLVNSMMPSVTSVNAKRAGETGMLRRVDEIACEGRFAATGVCGSVNRSDNRDGTGQYGASHSFVDQMPIPARDRCDRSASRGGHQLARPHQFVRSIENSTASSSACFIGAAGNSASASFAMAP